MKILFICILLIAISACSFRRHLRKSHKLHHTLPGPVYPPSKEGNMPKGQHRKIQSVYNQKIKQGNKNEAVGSYSIGQKTYYPEGIPSIFNDYPPKNA